MTDRLWYVEAEQFLEERFQALCATLDQPLTIAGLRIGPLLSPDEARLFLLSHEAGLFALDTEGFVESPLLAVSSGEGAGAMLQLFDRNPPRLVRETIGKLCTAASLILDKGWLPRQVEIEGTRLTDDPLSHGVDLRLKSMAGELLAAAVVKRRPHELDKLKLDLRQCCKRGSHPNENCGFPQNHAKYEFCASYKPNYLWGVAPDAEICFRMEYLENGVIELDELSSLPPRSILDR